MLNPRSLLALATEYKYHRWALIISNCNLMSDLDDDEYEKRKDDPPINDNDRESVRVALREMEVN